MLLIENVTAVTVDATRRIITDAAIAVDGARIAEVGKTLILRAHYANAERFDGGEMLSKLVIGGPFLYFRHFLPPAARRWLFQALVARKM